MFLEVTDTGDGIASEDLDMILEPFYTTKKSEYGTGLAGVVAAIQKCRGAIGIHSEQGVGTTFRVLFPAVDRTHNYISRSNRPRHDFQGVGKVLVADDDEMIRSITAKLLQEAGFDIMMATDGFEALQVLDNHSEEIRLVLLDMAMPRLNGEEAAEQIRNTLLQMPILFSSGYSMDFFQTTLWQYRKTAFLQKPYRYSDLIDCIRLLLDESAQSNVIRESPHDIGLRRKHV